MTKIDRHETLLKRMGFTKLNPRSRFYPVGGPNGPGTAIYENSDGSIQIGLYANGAWDTSDPEGLDVHEGSDFESFKKHMEATA